MMNATVRKNEYGNWTAPLPLRSQVIRLPESYNEARKRLKATRKSLDRKPKMKDHYFSFMQKILDNGHAERVPGNEIHTSKPKWYLPHFGTYHPQKPSKIRVVFDSASEVEDISLNKLLLSGPDLVNSLLGVLMRFRRHVTAFVADIEQMFHAFHVEPEHRDFLRFLWYEGNNPDGEIVEYRMNVHLFGNTSSPAVATFCLRKTAREAETQFGSDAREFIEKDFYVDNGFKSLPGPEESIDLLKRTQSMLATANLRLHKIASNDPKVTEAFPSSDCATDSHNLDLNESTKHIQRSLGVHWELKLDTLGFTVSEETKPFTRRGVLSVVNSLFDPLGIAAPVVIKGKMLLRQMTCHLKGNHPGEWDRPLPNELYQPWAEWCTSLSTLQGVAVPRCYTTVPLDTAVLIELHVFCDASELGIAAVCYLKSVDTNGTTTVSFVLGKAKLAPIHATSMPRLELCAAVLAMEISELVRRETVFPPCPVIYHSDSKVVLGYIRNQTRRFYVYVSNRVEIIRRSTSPEDWRYVPTHLNPADCATRSVKASSLTTSHWLTGPDFLRSSREPETTDASEPTEVTEEDPEVRPSVRAFATEKSTNFVVESSRFTRFSQWPNLIAGFAALISKAQSLKHLKDSVATNPEDDKSDRPGGAAALRKRAENLIIRSVQHGAFVDEIELITKRKEGSPLAKLNPIVDENGLVRVGGRLSRADLTDKERHPVILPGSHHVATLLVRYHHQQIKHQGRHFTHGRIHATGYWIIGEKRLTNTIIHECVPCRKLRGRLACQETCRENALPRAHRLPTSVWMFSGPGKSPQDAQGEGPPGASVGLLYLLA